MGCAESSATAKYDQSRRGFASASSSRQRLTAAQREATERVRQRELEERLREQPVTSNNNSQAGSSNEVDSFGEFQSLAAAGPGRPSVERHSHRGVTSSQSSGSFNSALRASSGRQSQKGVSFSREVDMIGSEDEGTAGSLLEDAGDLSGDKFVAAETSGGLLGFVSGGGNEGHGTPSSRQGLPQHDESGAPPQQQDNLKGSLTKLKAGKGVKGVNTPLSETNPAVVSAPMPQKAKAGLRQVKGALENTSWNNPFGASGSAGSATSISRAEKEARKFRQAGGMIGIAGSGSTRSGWGSTSAGAQLIAQGAEGKKSGAHWLAQTVEDDSDDDDAWQQQDQDMADNPLSVTSEGGGYVMRGSTRSRGGSNRGGSSSGSGIGLNHGRGRKNLVNHLSAI